MKKARNLIYKCLLVVALTMIAYPAHQAFANSDPSQGGKTTNQTSTPTTTTVDINTIIHYMNYIGIVI